MARRGILKSLQEQCAGHRQSLLVRRVATPQELADYWPGGAENPNKKLSGWIHCYANYVAFLRRKDPTSAEHERQQKQRTILEALADQPELVELVATDAEGNHRAVKVYPKGVVALIEVHNRNLVLAAITDDANALMAHGTPDDVELLTRAYEEQGYLQRVIAWIATTEGPGLPFPERASRPEPPAAFGELHPADLYGIAAAFQRVNVLRLQALDSTRQSQTRPDWSVFFATLAETLKRPSTEVMRDMSLTSALAASAERARAHEQAMQAAKGKQELPKNIRRIA